MGRATNASADQPAARPDERPPTRRSSLAQSRSRNTRRRLIRAALEMWADDDFDQAFEATSAEDIARAAGVSKGTFYFHFAHKDDILLEMPWATAEIMSEEAAEAMAQGVVAPELIGQLMGSLAARVARAPRPAVLRVTGQWSRLIHTRGIPERSSSFAEAFEGVARYGVERGDLPTDLDVPELGRLLQAVTMDALVGWAAGDQSGDELSTTLRRRADVILFGAVAAPRR